MLTFTLVMFKILFIALTELNKILQWTYIMTPISDYINQRQSETQLEVWSLRLNLHIYTR
jgi:hypothetical protein